MLLAHPAALALNIPPKTVKSAQYFSQLCRVPADHNLPLWQWNMLCWALSNFFLFHHTLGTLHFIDPHFLWNSSSSYKVLCLYRPSKLPEKYSPSCIILFVLQFQGHGSSTPSVQNIAYILHPREAMSPDTFICSSNYFNPVNILCGWEIS